MFAPRFLPTLLVVAALLSAHCGPPERPPRMTDAEFQRASAVYGEVEPRPLVESLQVIESWLERRLRPAARTLLPGRTRRNIRTLLKTVDLEPTQEILTLYSWHNGQHGTPEAQFVPGYRLLSLESAIEEYRSLKRRVEQGAVEAPWWSPAYLPLLQSGEDLYLIACEGDRAGTVLDWSSTTGRTISHPSLAFLMQELAEGFERGAYVIRDDGSFARNEDKELEVFHRYHPALPSRRQLTSDRHLKTRERNHWGGGRTVTISLASGGTEIRTYDDRGLLTSMVVEFDGEPVQEEKTEYDERGRPILRRSRGYLNETIAWRYGEDGAVKIRKTTPLGQWLITAHRSPEGEWSVLSSEFSR